MESEAKTSGVTEPSSGKSRSTSCATVPVTNSHSLTLVFPEMLLLVTDLTKNLLSVCSWLIVVLLFMKQFSILNFAGEMSPASSATVSERSLVSEPYYYQYVRELLARHKKDVVGDYQE